MDAVSGTSGPHWRRVMAALANRDARTAFAQIVLGGSLGDVLPGVKDQRRTRAINVLLEAGLVVRTGSEGLEAGLVVRTGSEGLEASDAIFSDLLSQQPRRQPNTGLDRFMRLGRIERYPANKADRRELLAWIVGVAIQPGEDLTERQVNERLLSYTDDVVLLRRYLVDFGLLQRTASGSSYSRPDSGS